MYQVLENYVYIVLKEGDNDFFKYFWKDKVASTVGKLSLLDDPLDYLPPSYYIFLCPKTLSINF